MTDALFHIDNADSYVGQEIAVSDWITITQSQVDEFAHSTKDPDWMHIDVARSETESPYGTTIVQGFLMMSLVIHFSHECNLEPAGTVYGLNYGMDRVRFTDVVTVGSDVRVRVNLLSSEPRPHGRVLLKTEYRMEVKGKTKPAMVAEWLALYFTEMKHEQ